MKQSKTHRALKLLSLELWQPENNYKNTVYITEIQYMCIYHKWMSPAVNVKMKKLGPSAVCNIFFDQQGAAQSEYISFLIQLVN